MQRVGEETRDVVIQYGFQAEISKVEEIMEIMTFNVISLPALVVKWQRGDKGTYSLG